MNRLIDLLSLSRCIAVDGAGEPELGRAAMAWTFVNRARLAADHLRCHGKPHPSFGDGSVRDACLRHGWANRPISQPRYSDPALCRALATVSLISCRDIADPTGGATHYHHHAQCPAWSGQMTAVGLIGSYWFYRVRSR